VGGLRHLLLLDHRDAGHLLEGGGGLGLRLVVAVVVARTHVDDTHHQLVRSERAAGGRERAERSGSREAQQEFPAIELSHALLHFRSFVQRFPPWLSPFPAWRHGKSARTKPERAR